MDFKEHIASIINVLVFAGLIKIRFTLRRESTKVLLFPSTENDAERKSVRENTFFCSPISFRSFVFRSTAATCLHIDDKVERETPGDFDGLCEVYSMTARETFVLSSLLMHIQKLHHQWENREITKISKILILYAWINYDRESWWSIR